MFINNRYININSISFSISKFTNIIIVTRSFIYSSIIKSCNIKISCNRIKKIESIANKILIVSSLSTPRISRIFNIFSIIRTFINNRNFSSFILSYFRITSNESCIFNITFYFFIRNKPSNILIRNRT